MIDIYRSRLAAWLIPLVLVLSLLLGWLTPITLATRAGLPDAPDSVVSPLPQPVTAHVDWTMNQPLPVPAY